MHCWDALEILINAVQHHHHRFQEFWPLTYSSLPVKKSVFFAKFAKIVLLIVHWSSHSWKYYVITDVTAVANYAKNVDQTHFPWSGILMVAPMREQTNKVKTLRNAKLLTLDQVSKNILRLWRFLRNDLKGFGSEISFANFLFQRRRCSSPLSFPSRDIVMDPNTCHV